VRWLQILFLLFAPALKKLAQKEKHKPQDRQEGNPHLRGQRHKVLRVVCVLECCQHQSGHSNLVSLSACLCISSLLRVIFSFSFPLSTLNSHDYPAIHRKIGHRADTTGVAYTIASAPIPRNVPTAIGTGSQSPIANHALSPVRAPRALR